MAELRVDEIRVLADIQPRANSLSQSHVDDMCETLAAGKELPPIVVYYSQTDDYFLSEGFHRIEAYRRSGRATIPAEIRTGDLNDAKLNAMASNQTHGLKRTNDDKRRAVGEVMKLKPEWTNRRIAEYVGVTHSLVNDIRRVLEAASNTPTPKREGKDGRTYQPTKPQPPEPQEDDIGDTLDIPFDDGGDDDPEPVIESDDSADDNGSDDHSEQSNTFPQPKYTPPPKRRGQAPPPRPEYEGQVGKVMTLLTQTATALTKLVRDEDDRTAVKFVQALGALDLPWVRFHWCEGLERDPETGEMVPLDTPGPVFVALRPLRRLLALCYKNRRFTPKQLREYMTQDEPNALDSLTVPEDADA